jgi:hypothetical protein
LSRSIKHNPGYSDNGHGHNFHKKYANRKVRHTKIVGNFGKYKKLYEQWNIRDYNFRWYSQKEYFDHIINYWENDPNKIQKEFHRGLNK